MSKNVCYLCKKDVDNEFDMGEWKSKNKMDVHYYCLLLTSNLIQNGNDNQGILGFLINDIKTEVRRIKKQKCCFCHDPFAGIGCCAKKCMRTFHLSCGIQNKCRNYFTGTFQSFCDKHHKIVHKKKHETSTDCGICYENMGKYHPLNSIQSACCKTGWFHKLCLQKFAKSAGYFFKCPLCNNTEEFRHDVMSHGVFVPDKDAEWEMEPNAFSELLERANTCEAVNCICPKSRKFCDETEWEQIRCLTCGNSIHNKCIEDPTEHYICKICCKSKIDSETIAALKALSDDENSTDDEENSSTHTSRTAGSSQINVSSSSVNSRRTIFDYFSPGKKIILTKPCSILLERLNLNDFLKSDESSESTSYKLKNEIDENNDFKFNAKKRNERIKSETSDDSVIVKNKITDLSSPLFPKLSRKWIDLLHATYDSDSEVEEITTRRASKRRISDTSNSSCSSIFPVKRRKNNVQINDSPQLAETVCTRRRSIRIMSKDSSNPSPITTGSESDFIRRKNVVKTPEMSDSSQLVGAVCTRRRSIRLMSTSTDSSNKNFGSSPLTTGSESDSIRQSHRKSVSSISNTSDMEIDDERQSSSSEIKEKIQIENNNNSQKESKKTINQTDHLIDFQELKRIKLEMKSIDVVARNHCDLFCNTLNSGSIYSAKERKIEIIKKNETNFSSTESESDIGINDVVDNKTESNLSSTDDVSEKIFFKLQTKDSSSDSSKKFNKRKSLETGLARKSINTKIETIPFKLNDNNRSHEKISKKSPGCKIKPKFNLKSSQGQTNRIDNYFTVYSGRKN